MNALALFPPDYLTARTRFLAAAAAATARCASFEFGIAGPAGEVLAIDSAYVGEPHAPRLLVLSSGLHGIEGYFGSALQLAWLDTLAHPQALPPQTGVLLVHAINPYGFAWRRRWNENNVDLNRNFIADRSFVTDDPVYAESRRLYDALNPFLNPATPPATLEPYRLQAAALILARGLAMRRKMSAAIRPPLVAVRRVIELGSAELEQAITVGQYEHPDALFYGGTTLEPGAAHVAELLSGHARHAENIIHVDFHTGLGACGEYRLLVADDRGSAAERWAGQAFGAASVKAKDTPYRERGVMMRYLAERLGPERYHGLVAEFGTHTPLRVLGALRTERRAHLYCQPASPTYESAKRELMEAFCPASPAWRKAVLTQGLVIVQQALAACAA